MEVLQQTLLEALSSPKTISAENQQTLEKASQEFPYFQLAHTLVAKVKHDQQAPDAYESLGMAAIYAPDRRHMRKVFYEDIHISWNPPEPDVLEPESPAAVDDLSQDEVTQTFPEQPSDSAEDVFETNDDSETIEKTDQPKEPENKGVANHDEEEEIVYRELEENLRNLRKAKEESQREDDDEEEDKKKIAEENEETAAGKNRMSNQHGQSPLLMDYFHSLDPVDLEHLDIHQQKQNELISKFVNSDTTSIGRIRPSVPENESDSQDLSETSSAYNEQLVTENLAEIMLRQGKKEKAIKIYEQLQLKYPEKKAFFAGKIEQIKQQ